ncbi:hypothetical protein CPter291_1837 [Collimonas pratensis]|uniref:Uncharacterized protein n=1 Tax=Collimonas pratensis TaxID=279113 RepID=A0ABN4M785_9BURK|nr:hypothetical protein CPter291_1837 [Collimonas pratensis]
MGKKLVKNTITSTNNNVARGISRKPEKMFFPGLIKIVKKLNKLENSVKK